MNHLVFVNAQAGELEKILSGVKTMLLREIDPAQPPAQTVCPGDSLFFLRDTNDCAVRVKATVVRVLSSTNFLEEDLSQTLNEMQPKLQLTEDQYNYWSVKQLVWLVEFEAARKINAIQLAQNIIASKSGWIAFESFDLVQ